MITVSQLIDLLSKHPPDLPVFIEKDVEWNGVLPILNYEELIGWEDGQSYIIELTPELAEQGYNEEDVMPERALKVLCLTANSHFRQESEG